LNIVKLWVPLSFAAFDDYCIGSVNISKQGIEAIRQMFFGIDSDTVINLGMTKKEYDEIMKIIS
jgi:thymidylate synthase (FAD)